VALYVGAEEIDDITGKAKRKVIEAESAEGVIKEAFPCGSLREE
jgi:hypothetical protein